MQCIFKHYLFVSFLGSLARLTSVVCVGYIKYDLPRQLEIVKQRTWKNWISRPHQGRGGPTVIWVWASSDISTVRVGWTSELRKEIIAGDILSQHEICGSSELTQIIVITVVWPGLVTLKLSNSFRIRKLNFLSESEVINIVFLHQLNVLQMQATALLYGPATLSAICISHQSTLRPWDWDSEILDSVSVPWLYKFIYLYKRLLTICIKEY